MNAFDFIKKKVGAGEHLELKGGKSGSYAIASDAPMLKGKFLSCNGFVVHTTNGYCEAIENAEEWEDFNFWCLDGTRSNPRIYK